MTAPMRADPSQMPAAVLVGLEDIRGVHAARTLAAHGVRVVGISRSAKSYGRRTRACSEVHYADTRTAAFVDLLESMAPSFTVPPVLVPCTDMAALFVSRHRDRLAGYRLTLPSIETVEALMDKVAFYQWAEAEGHPIPRTRFVTTAEELADAADSLQFPLVVKPPNSKSPTWLAHTNAKAFRVDGRAELDRIFADYGPPVATPLVVQEWIAGPETELYACHGYFDESGEPLATFVSRKVRQWPVETGQACLSEEVHDEVVCEITRKLFRSVDFRGLGYVEIKRDVNTGQYLIVEPNIGRVSGRMAIAEAGGVELLHTMYCDAAGLALPGARTQTSHGRAKWIYLRQDLMSSLKYLRRGELTLGGWLRTMRGRKRFALLSLRDPAPFVFDLLRCVGLASRREERQRRRAKTRTAKAPSARSAKAFFEGVFDRPYAETRYAYPEKPEGHYITPHLRRFLEANDLLDKRCLEVGTGYGQCQHLVNDYVGVDLAFSAAKHLEKPFVNARASRLPFPDATFDCVWSNHVMEHVPHPEAMLAEIWRVLKPGGFVFFTATWQCAPWLAQGYPVRPASELDWRGKIVKYTAPVRGSVPYRSMHVFPRRARNALSHVVRRAPVDLYYKRLHPTYEHNWMPDATAETSVEPYSVYLWFTSRGAECLNYPTPARAFLMRTGHLTFRKPPG